MKRVRLSNKVRRTPGRSSGGFTLIEVLVALALFGIIAITFLGGLTTASRAVLTGDIRTTAESLARTHMEYVKNQDLSTAPWDYELTAFHRSRTYNDPEDERPTWWDPSEDVPPLLSTEHAAYTVEVEAQSLHDDDIQKITVTVSHEGRVVFTLEGYKISR